MRTVTYEGAARAGGPPEARETAVARISAGMLAGAVAASRNSRSRYTNSENASCNRNINSIKCTELPTETSAAVHGRQHTNIRDASSKISTATASRQILTLCKRTKK